MISISEKYRGLSPAVRAALWFTICSALQKSVSLLCTPIFTRILTSEEYGVYSVYLSWSSIIQVFATLNLFYGVFNNGMIKFENRKNSFISSMQSLISCLTMSLFIIYIAAHNFWNSIFELPTILVVSMFIDLIFLSAFNLWAAEQRYNYKYKHLVFLTILMSISSPTLGIITILLTDHKAEARILSFVLVEVCFGLVLYVYNYRKGKTFYNREFWRFAILFNLPLIPHYLSLTILNQVDRIMINHMEGAHEAAVYSVAYTVGMFMTIVTSAINNSFVPYSYKSLKREEYKSIGRNANTILAIIGVSCILTMALGPEIIKLFATNEYFDAIWVIPPVAASVYFLFLYPLFSNISFYFEKTKFIMVASCIGAIVNVILNLLFIPIYGYYAAGYTTLACYMLFSFVHYLIHKKTLKQNTDGVKIYNTKIILLMSGFIILSMILISFLYKMTTIRYLFIVSIFTIFFVKRKKIINGLRSAINLDV